MARKSSYSLKIVQDICDRIAGGKSLVSVCKTKKLTYSTVMRWLEQQEEFREMYAQAREHQADYLADEVVDIADNRRLQPEDKRIRVDARKWKAGKLKPKKYGDRVENVHTDPDGKPLPAQQNNIILNAELKGKSAAELTKLLTEKLKG